MTEALKVDPIAPEVPFEGTTGLPDQRQFRDPFVVENRGREIVNRQPRPDGEGLDHWCKSQGRN
jgi:hypothetical protein